MRAEDEIRRLVTRVVDRALAGEIGGGGDSGGGAEIAIGCDHGGFRMKELLK